MSFRPEQNVLDNLLLPSLLSIIIMRQQEQEILVSHPELAPEPYITTVDNYYCIKGYDNKAISLCCDLHGSWHGKNKISGPDGEGGRDWKKRQVLEYNGHHYIEFKNYPGEERCPAIWEVVELTDQVKKINERGTSNMTRLKILNDSLNNAINNASKQVAQQLLIQLSISRPRDIPPQGVKIINKITLN